MLPASTILQMQKAQFAHDKRNHADILSLHKTDRMKHYGLHFCKYVGRIARGPLESKSLSRTITDAVLVCLSAANTLHQDFSKEIALDPSFVRRDDIFRLFADAAGRFADACEKIDHLEDFIVIARNANRDIMTWALRVSADLDLDISYLIAERRFELRARQFYVED